MLFPIQACTFGTAGQACHFQMPLLRRSIRSNFSIILMQKLKGAHCFENAGVVCSRKVLRLVRAGRGAYLRAYSGPWELLADMRPLDRTVDGWRDRLLSHHASGQVVREYKNIRSATAGLGSTIFLYHHISNNAPTGIANAEPLPVLGRKSVKAELSYDWTNARTGTRWLPCVAILL
jgi:hypothetical protein